MPSSKYHGDDRNASKQLRLGIFVATVASWIISERSSFDVAIVVSIVVVVIIIERSTLTSQKKASETKAPDLKFTQSARATCALVESDAAREQPQCGEDKKRSMVSIVWEDLRVDDSTKAHVNEVLTTNPSEAAKLFAWLDQMENAPRQGSTNDHVWFAILVHVAALANTEHCLERVLLCMESCKVRVTAKMYYEIISRAGKKGKQLAAKFWFDEMKRAGIKGDVHTYSSLIHSCAKRRHLDEAMRWYETMLRPFCEMLTCFLLN